MHARLGLPRPLRPARWPAPSRPVLHRPSPGGRAARGRGARPVLPRLRGSAFRRRNPAGARAGALPYELMRFFYPAAALYAAAGLPWSVFFLRSPLDHAHEMLFGYALAVVAGNQLGIAGGARVALLGATW